MQIVAAAWNEGDAPKAADCFAESAVDAEPPNKQVYVGKRLYDFFGGGRKPEPPMKMECIIWVSTNKIRSGLASAFFR